MRLGVIVGSTRPGRFAPKVAGWFLPHVEAHDGFEADVLDLVELDLPSVWTREPSPGLDDFKARIACADAFVVTGEYNHSFPAALKHAIDLAKLEWEAKPVGFVSYGGTSGGLRAVEQLRLVFAELHATTVRDCVSLHMPFTWFEPDAPGDVLAGADLAAKVMLDQLAWWGRALRTARRTTPYR